MENTIAQLLQFLWRHKRWLYATIFLFLGSGLATGLLMKPVYYSEAILSPKDQQKNQSAAGFLSQFGGGGSLATALGVGNTSLQKIQLLLESLELSESVIKTNNLLPKIYPEAWDVAGNRWKDSSRIPNARKAAESLRKSTISVSNNPRQNIVILGAFFSDSTMAAKLVGYYINALNARIREGVIRDAEGNRAYLESQLTSSVDPVLRHRIQELIGLEIEKAMLVSTQSIEILSNAAVPYERIRPKRRFILVISFFLSLSAYFSGCILAFFLKEHGKKIYGIFMGEKKPKA